MQKNLADYVDVNNLIGQRKMKDGKKWVEGGDSLQRCGFAAIGSYIEYGKSSAVLFNERIKHYEIKSGIFVRHPDKNEWYSKESSTSRDQYTPNIIACGLFGRHDILWRILIEHIKRFGFYTNWKESNGQTKIADFASPEHCGFYIRGFNALPLWPILFISDIFSVIGSCYKAFIYSREPKNVDDLNRLVSLVQSELIMPTPLSKLSLWIYKKGRSHYKGMSRARYALTRYFGEGPFYETESPPLATAWDAALKKYFD